MTPDRVRFRRSALAIASALLLLTTGCGNRVPHADVVAAGNGYGPVDLPPGAAGPASGAAAPGATAAAPGSTAPGAPAAAPGTADNPLAPAGVPGGATPGAAGPSGIKNGAPASGAAAAPCPSALSPIVLGQTLASSGLVGAAYAGMRPGLAAWAKDVNSRGGVQCHPIQLIQLDDGSDPARVAANWNTLIHDRGAVAMVGAGVSIAIKSLRSSAERDRVPVVGGDGTAQDWIQSPYLFPVGTAPLAAYDGAVVDAARSATNGAPKAGMLYCVEASICSDLKNNHPIAAKRAGAALGPVQPISLTQPDFSSECQTMKAAGVNVIFLAMDGSAGIRTARSCAGLNYYPTFATAAIAVSAAAAADAGLRRNKTFLGSSIVPYTLNDSPGLQAFHQAMQRYAPTTKEDQLTLLGWASGKLFEAALAKVATEARAGNVTTQLILKGLWQLKNERLDGLSPGATFTENAPAKALDCYYGLRLDESGFAAVRGSTLVCFKNDRPVDSPAKPAPRSPSAKSFNEQQVLTRRTESAVGAAERTG